VSPPLALWEELNELTAMRGQGKAWPWISRRRPGQAIPLCATWHHHVLDAVVRHCSDGEFSGASPGALYRLVRCIISTWDSSVANQAWWQGAALELLKQWGREAVAHSVRLDLAVNPHPEVAPYMREQGARFARRILDIPAKSPQEALVETQKEETAPRRQ